ncbi:pirin family protein [Motiliproteus sp. SC1-56]|uniref:pirin family protein n=1 Tax=Motiliproteus sp. SC1-56 TaxID=2799565 RepID=UPI001A8F849C|nr:pirin family protein [Motiliproteus sp. SC1-56]
MSACQQVAIIHRVRGQETPDGAGVRLRRVLGNSQLRRFDPFLMLDELKSDQPGDYIAGFPDHPHRGFETVSYQLEGEMEHRDHLGNHGLVEPGGAQWMTAGRGVIHSEMPRPREGSLWGFQLWINLPAAQKLCAPRYRGLAAADIPEVEDAQGVVRRVIAGNSLGVAGAVGDIFVDPLFVDLRFPPGASLVHPLEPGHHSLLYCYRGSLEVAGERLPAGELAVLGEGSELGLIAAGEGAGALLLSARPLNEPVAQYGPFVMNTGAEIEQALRDYQNGTLVQR